MTNPEQSKEAGSKRRYAYWAVVLLVTAVISVPAYRTWARVSAVKNSLATAQQHERSIQEEHAMWTGLDAQLKVARKSVSQQKQDVIAAVKSFSREDLHGALRRAIEAANPSKAVVVRSNSSVWGADAWIWLPEEGHRLSVQISATGPERADVVGAPFVNQDLQRDLPPRRLHRVRLSIAERHKTKDSVLTVQLNEERLFEKRLLLDVRSSSSSGGSNDRILFLPRTLSTNWAWRKSPVELHRRGIWITLEREEFGLEPHGKKRDGQKVKIACSIGIATDRPRYAQPVSKSALTKNGISFTEVTDRQSPYVGLLEVKRP